MRTHRPRSLAWLFGLALLLAPAAGRAGVEHYELHIGNLSALDPAGAPYYLDFTLIGTQNNQVSIHGATFGGGGVSGPPILFGSATGDLSTTASLDSNPANPSFVSDITQPISFPATSFFDVFVDITTNFDGINAPDELDFSIFMTDPTTSALVPIPTTDPLGVDTLVRVTIDGPVPTVETYSNRTTGPASFDRVVVPEPSSVLLVAIGGVAVAGLGWRRRRLTGSP